MSMLQGGFHRQVGEVIRTNVKAPFFSFCSSVGCNTNLNNLSSGLSENFFTIDLSLLQKILTERMIERERNEGQTKRE